MNKRKLGTNEKFVKKLEHRLWKKLEKKNTKMAKNMNNVAKKTWQKLEKLGKMLKNMAN